MIEIMVATLCVGGWSCKEALKQYYSTHPHLKYIQRRAKNYTEQIIGEEMVFIAPAVYAIVTNNAYEIRLTRRWSVGKMNGNGYDVRWRYDF